MSIRGNILNFILNPMLRHVDRLRVVQTLEMLEYVGPFSTPRFQGDTHNECNVLRRWVNHGTGLPNTLASPGMGVTDAFAEPAYQEWAKRCPFKREVHGWDTRTWFWGDPAGCKVPN